MWLPPADVNYVLIGRFLTKRQIPSESLPSWRLPVRTKKPPQQKKPAKNELKGNVPTRSMYANCSNDSMLTGRLSITIFHG